MAESQPRPTELRFGYRGWGALGSQSVAGGNVSPLFPDATHMHQHRRFTSSAVGVSSANHDEPGVGNWLNL